MNIEDGDKFRNLIRGMARVFSTEADGLLLETYWLALKSWPLPEFEGACARLLCTSKFMPRPADFNELRKASALCAGEAFARAMEVARNCSSREIASSGDPCIDAAAQACGGYFAMGMNETDKIGFLERRFTEHFETISDREETRDAIPSIAGPRLHRGPTNGPKRISEIFVSDPE